MPAKKLEKQIIKTVISELRALDNVSIQNQERVIMVSAKKHGKTKDALNSAKKGVTEQGLNQYDIRK